MSGENQTSALSRMIGSRPRHSETVAMSPATALRKGIVRAAQNHNGLVAAVTGFSEKRSALSLLIEQLPDNALLMMLEDEGGGVALVAADIDFLSAVVEHSTTGRVIPSPATPRGPTRTDAVILSDLLDAIFVLSDQTMASMENAPPVTGFRYSRTLENGRAITMAMEEMPYRKYEVSVDFGQGAKTGTLQLIYPWFSANAEQLGSQRSVTWRANLQGSVMRSETQIEAILHRFAMSLSDVTDWKEGTLVPIPFETLGDISLEGLDGKRTGAAKLGQSRGMRAVRILPQVTPDRGEVKRPPLVRPLSAPDEKTGDGTNEEASVPYEPEKVLLEQVNEPV